MGLFHRVVESKEQEQEGHPGLLHQAEWRTHVTETEQQAAVTATETADMAGDQMGAESADSPDLSEKKKPSTHSWRLAA